MELECSIHLGDLVAQHFEASVSKSPDTSPVPVVPQRTGVPRLRFPSVPVLPPHPASLWPHQEEKRTAYEKSVNILDFSKLMYKYPWLDYPERTKARPVVLKVCSQDQQHQYLVRNANSQTPTPQNYLIKTLGMSPRNLYFNKLSRNIPCDCSATHITQKPKEEIPPSPERWRQYPSKPNSVCYCYFKKPEICTHWHTLYDQRQEWEAQKMLQKMRDHPRYIKEGTPIQKFHLPKSKLTIKSQVAPKALDPTGDPLKWQRLKELTSSLKSPREDEQFYAAQALGCLGVGDKFVMEALWQVAQTGPEKVKYEACRTLAVLGCLNKHVIQALIEQLKGQNEGQMMDTLTGLRVALNSWAAVPKDKRTQVGNEEKLVPVLQMLIKKSSNDAAVEAALCLGFLRPCSNIAREFLLQSLCQGPKTQRMKALRMLVKMMRVHSATVIKAILDQLCYSSVLEHRFEATQMLKTIGLEQIQAQGLEGLTFDLLRRKTYNEPFLAVRQAVAETVEELKMKRAMMNLVEAQLMNSNATARQEAVISLGVLGIRNPQVFHLLLDMLDAEKNQPLKKSLQETLILLASTDPWIQNKLKNKVLFVCEAPRTNEKAEPTRFQKEPVKPEELNIQDFQLAQLNPFAAKSSTTSDQQNKSSAQKGSAFYLTSAFPPCFPKPLKQKSQATGPWTPAIRRQLQILAKTSK